MARDRHRLLKRQLRRTLAGVDLTALEPFLEVVDEAYRQADLDRTRMERALELSSEELLESNQELREARDVANAASLSKSTFLANLSHELRNPLTAVLGFSEILADEARTAGRHEQHRDLGYISEAGQHMLALVDDILDLSKLEAGRVPLQLEALDLVDLCRSVVASTGPAATTHRVHLTMATGVGVPAVVADRKRARQCVLNLLSNAVKFGAGGPVDVRIDAEGPVVAVRVTDHGIGMTAEQLGRVFEPFVQAEETTEVRFGGTGLGLPISQGLAELMGGSLTAESEPGRGSTFTLRLPRAEPHDNRFDLFEST